ncbi:MROH1 protein, partial [Sitta europaea]|nr:MROH1 protein [Sitta europaea]
AGALLVALGRRSLGAVLEELLRQIQPGILPRAGTLRTLGTLATGNVFGMVPFLSSILGTLLPMLPMARTDSMKSAFCY